MNKNNVNIMRLYSVLWRIWERCSAVHQRAAPVSSVVSTHLLCVALA